MERNASDLTPSPKKKWENIFKVRKVNHVIVPNKCTQIIDSDEKSTYPFKGQTLKRGCQNENGLKKVPTKCADYHYHFLIISSPIYKELNHKYQTLRQQESQRKAEREQIFNRKNQELQQIQGERRRLSSEREKLLEKQNQLKRKIQFLRNMRENRQHQRNQQFSILPQHMFSQSPFDEQYGYLGLQNLRNMALSMRYQNGLDINPDQMTYEELLQLEEKMGSVSKGLTHEQIGELQVFEVKKSESSQQRILCSICYENAEEGEKMNRLPCSHCFHSDCVKEWLMKEKICPLCKQEIKFDQENRQLTEEASENQEKSEENQSQEIKQSREGFEDYLNAGIQSSSSAIGEVGQEPCQPVEEIQKDI